MDAIDGLGVVQVEHLNPDTPVMTDSTKPYSGEDFLRHRKTTILRFSDESKTWDELKHWDPVELLVFLSGLGPNKGGWDPLASCKIDSLAV
jgi:hypothetical protein